MIVTQSSSAVAVGGIPQGAPQSVSVDSGWLLLVYCLRAKSTGTRVQAWRRLQRIGAVLLKNSAYALPNSPESREDFEWVKNEIIGSGGQAMVFIARAPDQATEDEIVEAFRAARTPDYVALAADASRLLHLANSKGANRRRRELTQGARRLRERFDELVRLDFFGAPARDDVARLLARIEDSTGRRRIMPSASRTAAKAADYRGRVWLTRPHPGVDRMSSAWLIRRFIDPEARFVFGDVQTVPDAIPFDTFEAEFGHHGAHCTFETLCDRFAITDPSVLYLGRIVHDLDLKQTTYGEADTATVGRLVEGLRRSGHDDDALLRMGADLFEALYQSLARESGSSASLGRAPAASRRRTRVETRRRKSARS